MAQFTDISATAAETQLDSASPATGASYPREYDAAPRPTDARPSWQPVLEALQRRFADSPAISRWQRVAEIAIAAVLLVVTAPLMALVALIVKLDSPGPVVFRQTRIGRHGRLFQFAKFRTLYADARLRWPDLYAYNYTADQIAALHFKLRDDPRVTRAGHWLRKSTLDELPNLWNVLLGDVALVGPRPEIPEMLPYYDEEALEKFSVRPGVTGLAQTRGRGDLSFRDTLAFDLEYVRSRSWRLDFEILATTVRCTLLRRGAF